MNARTIDPKSLAEIRKTRSIELIDVRSPFEYQSIHIPEARNMPLDELDAAEMARAHAQSTEPLYIVCQSGSRGRQACAKLQTAGFENTVNVEGGTSAWAAAGLPVVRGRSIMSLERQVRIAAGSLALAGVLLAQFVHPAFVGLSAFIGAGLIFAGVTDTCGMAMFLAKMPWNQITTANCTTPSTAAKEVVS